jgi:hypothetical protein
MLGNHMREGYGGGGTAGAAACDRWLRHMLPWRYGLLWPCGAFPAPLNSLLSG